MNPTRSFLKKTIPLALPTLVALVALSPLAAPAQDKEKDTPLAIEMKGMSKDYKQLKKQIADPAQKPSSLDLLADIDKHVKAARDLTPANTVKVPEADRAAWLADYKKQIDGLLAAYDKVQAALTGDQYDQAKSLLDDILKLKREGHEKFAKEEK